jgi:glycopeptide antibiotics resistance protein
MTHPQVAATKGRNPLLSSLLWLAFIIYSFLLVKFVLVKNPDFFIRQLRHFNNQGTEGRPANFVPFRTILYYVTLQERAENGMENLGGNLVGFMPLGFFLPVLFPYFRRARRALAGVFGTSLFFELFQLLTGVGSFDVDDLLLNTLGGLLGFYLTVWIFGLRKRPGSRR